MAGRELAAAGGVKANTGLTGVREKCRNRKTESAYLIRKRIGVRPMAVKDTVIKKLQQATCDKTELNKKVVRWQKSLREAEKALKDGGKKKKEGK